MYLFSPKQSLKALLVAVVILHFALQILSNQFYATEIPWLGALIYIISGGVGLLASAHVIRKAVNQKSRTFLNMGVAIWMFGLTNILAGLGLVGLFGPASTANINLAYYLLVFGFGLTALFFHASHTEKRIRSIAHIILVGTILMVVGVAVLYKYHGLLPPLFTTEGITTLVRQQLLTLVLILFCTASARFAIDYWAKNQRAWQWYVISLGIMGLAMLDFLLSAVPGDAYSWAGRFMLLAASFGLIQYRWWDEQEG